MTNALTTDCCRLVLVRHEHTAMAGTFCGHSDPPLSAQGKAQLKEVIQRLRMYSFQCVYSSDLCRAAQTARHIARARHVPLYLRSDLREIAFGEWEGLDWPRIVARDPEYAQRWLALYPNLGIPGGEPFGEFQARITRAMNEIALELPGGCAAIVTHAGVIRTFLQDVLLSPEQVLQFATPTYGSGIEVWQRKGRWVFPAFEDEAVGAPEHLPEAHSKVRT
jgi:broad specificity phosphatase PhoE